MTKSEEHAVSKLSPVDGLTSMELSGKRLLIVEDEFMIADELARDLKTYGIDGNGPVASFYAARTTVADELHLDGAILDINLRGEVAFQLIDALRAREVPCVLYTGYDHATVPAAYQDVPFCPKPTETEDILKALFA